MTLTRNNPCEAAHEIVVSQCKDQCSECTLEESGCTERSISAFTFRQKFENSQAAEAGAGERDHIAVALAGKVIGPLFSVGLFVLFVAGAVLGVRSWSRSRRSKSRRIYMNLRSHEDADLNDYDSALECPE